MEGTRQHISGCRRNGIRRPPVLTVVIEPRDLRCCDRLASSPTQVIKQIGSEVEIHGEPSGMLPSEQSFAGGHTSEVLLHMWPKRRPSRSTTIPDKIHHGHTLVGRCAKS